SLRFIAPPSTTLDQAMAVEHRMHCADRGGVDVRIEARQLLPDLGRAPTRLVVLEAHDLRLALEGQLVGLAGGAAGAVGEPVKTDLVVTADDLVAGLARDAELAAQAGHLLSLEQTGDEFEPFVHGITLLPGHFALPAKSPIV